MGGSPVPAREERLGGTGVPVRPERAEPFFEGPGAPDLEILALQVAERRALLVAHVLRPAQPQVLRAGEPLVAGSLEGAVLPGTDVIDGVVQMFDDVELVEHDLVGCLGQMELPRRWRRDVKANLQSARSVQFFVTMGVCRSLRRRQSSIRGRYGPRLRCEEPGPRQFPGLVAHGSTWGHGLHRGRAGGIGHASGRDGTPAGFGARRYRRVTVW